MGIILLILGFVLGIPILWTIGIILIVVGAVLSILGATGRAIGGGRPGTDEHPSGAVLDADSDPAGLVRDRPGRAGAENMARR